MRYRPHPQAQRRVAHHRHQSRDNDNGENDDGEAVERDRETTQREIAAHPVRRADILVLGAEDAADRLLQDEAKSPGCQQGFQRSAIEEADHAAFDQDTDRTGDQKGGRDRDDQAAAKHIRNIGTEDLLHAEGDIGADHNHFAMRHVDHAHHAEGDGEASGGE